MSLTLPEKAEFDTVYMTVRKERQQGLLLISERILKALSGRLIFSKKISF